MPTTTTTTLRYVTLHYTTLRYNNNYNYYYPLKGEL